MFITINETDKIIALLKGATHIAFDLTTAPDDAFRSEKKASQDAHKAHIVGISFCADDSDAFYVPLAHRCGNVDNPERLWRFLKKEVFENRSVVKISHDLIFSSMFLYSLGIILQSPCYDTLTAARLKLENSSSKFRLRPDCTPDKLLNRPIDIDVPEHLDELDPMHESTICRTCSSASDIMKLYHKLNTWFEENIPNHRRIAEDIESPTDVFCGIMRYNGIPMSRKNLLKAKSKMEASLCKLRESIDSFTGGIDFGTASTTPEFREFLRDKLCLPEDAPTTKNVTENDTMNFFKAYCRDNRPELLPLFECIEEYRSLNSAKIRYIDSFLCYVNPLTDRIHPDIDPLGAETGRFSCSNPNMQNCPRKAVGPVNVRSLICAEEGNILLSVDYSQIELRVGAFYCRDPKMLKAYSEGGDIHSATASVIYNLPYKVACDKSDPDYKERRSIAKRCNFSVLYGITARGLKGKLAEEQIQITTKESEKIINNIKLGYPGIFTWQKQAIQSCDDMGYMETALGRRRYIHSIYSTNRKERTKAEKQALNMPIQGTAADILKIACGRITEGLPSVPWLRPILQVHDELLFELPYDKLPEAVAFIRRCMEQKPFEGFDVSLVADASVGYSYGEMKIL